MLPPPLLIPPNYSAPPSTGPVVLKSTYGGKREGVSSPLITVQPPIYCGPVVFKSTYGGRGEGVSSPLITVHPHLLGQ